MISSTFLNLVVIPVLYVVIEGWRERRSGPSLSRAAELAEEDQTHQSMAWRHGPQE